MPDSKKVYVIAEAGVNHNGSLDLARQLIDAAAEAGADAVKFQTFKAETLVTQNAATAEYQQQTTGELTQFAMLKKLELDLDAHRTLQDHARQQNIDFLSTAFDLDSLQLLHQIGIPLFKIPSGEITNYPLVRGIGELGKPVVVSTGMANLNEIEACLNLLASVGCKSQNTTVLHCNTQYPTPMKDVNLRAMNAIGAAFPEIQIGYSDHTLGIEIPIAAVALGAKVIEKHITLDRQMPGPDHAASLEPSELKQMMISIRNIETALGDGTKQPTPSETPNIPVARKSIVAAQPIARGEAFSAVNLTTKRPGTGLSPMVWPEIVGQISDRDYQLDEPIEMPKTS